MSQNKYYAGIGWRETPDDVLETIKQYGQVLAEAGYTLRSGHGDRADKAWEEGANDQVDRMYKKADPATHGDARCEIWLPWHGFNGSSGSFTTNGHRFAPITPRSIEVAKTQLPNWDEMKKSHQQLFNRNSYQLFGEALKVHQAVPFTKEETDAFSKFVIGYTEGGKGKGGTGYTFRLAKSVGIPVFDLAIPDDVQRLREFGRTL